MSKGTTVDSFIKNHTNFIEDKIVKFDKPASNYQNVNQPNDAVISLLEINKWQHVSRGFRTINAHLKTGGIMIGSVETHEQMRNKKAAYKVPIIGHAFKTVDFVFHRVFPKMKWLKNVYYFTTKGKNRRLTKAEVLGRIVSNGFEIREVADNINGKLHFAAIKVAEAKSGVKSSYGPIYRMPRIGKDGKIIHVYKFRTMHPYSEHLQDYVLKQNGYASNGKPANDFRLTSWGKVLRKYWLDEIPQLINVVKRDMKLVGVRPVSQRYFQDIPNHIQELRLLQKPGCIPPYVAFNKKNSKDDVLVAEEIYLRLCKKKDRQIDSSLVYLAIRNILFKGMRSA